MHCLWVAVRYAVYVVCCLLFFVLVCWRFVGCWLAVVRSKLTAVCRFLVADCRLLCVGGC